jgi:hypothetical protein
MKVAATALTVMLCRPHSIARHLVGWATAALARAINRLARQGDKARLRAQVDDPTIAAADHVPSDLLAGEEGRLHVEVERQVESSSVTSSARPLRTAADVVDQDVDAAEVRDRAVDGSIDLGEPGDVHLQRQGAPACGFDLACEIAAAARVAQAQRRPRRRVHTSCPVLLDVYLFR